MDNKKGFNYKIQIDTEISESLKKLQVLKENLEGLGKFNTKALQQELKDSQNILNKLKKSIEAPVTSEAELNKVSTQLGALNLRASELEDTVKRLSKLTYSQKLQIADDATLKRIEAIDNAIKKANEGIETSKKKTQQLIDAEKRLESINKKKKDLQLNELQIQGSANSAKQTKEKSEAELAAIRKANEAKITQYKDYIEKQDSLDALRKSKRRVSEDKIKAAEDVVSGARNSLLGLEGSNKRFSNEMDEKSFYKAVVEEKLRLNEEIAKANKKFTEDENRFENYNKDLADLKTAMEGFNVAGEEAETAINNLKDAFENAKGVIPTNTYKELRNILIGLDKTYENLSETAGKNSTEEMLKAFQGLKDNVFVGLDEEIDKTIQALNQFRQIQDEVQGKGASYIAEGNQKLERAQQIDSVANATKHFVGLAGAIDLARKAMTKAWSTVQELDEVMTEMAVVTDASIDDYWEQLDEYTDRANELGVSISGAYEAQTLFLQQGLDAAQATELSTEALKMARIAGIDYSDATDLMTSALRGFNMELNKTSAQRVADVYAELAAVSAADTGEISTAMSKVASLASNAGMEFETTAAFLTQIIETTREPAESAGTALIKNRA